MAISKAEKVPQEIIFDILSRLPAKSIGQFRCVSKQWLSLLSDPQFIEAHLTIHTHHQEKLILVSDSHSVHTITFSQNIINPQNGTDAISRKLNFQSLSENWESVAGSCNGLVLLVTEENKIFLMNPTTLEYHRIPNSPCALPVPGSFSMYGLGYDVVSDDYKVVTLSYYDTDNEYEPDVVDTFVDVYSVKMGIWRRLESSPYDHSVPYLAPGVLLNGALHWLASVDSYTSVIAAFDLNDEKFFEVPAPATCDKGRFVFGKLVALGGCLCMCTFTAIDNKNYLWMMKEYGVEESWTEFVVIEGDLVNGLRPFCLLSEDDVVFNGDGEKLILYNMKDGQWRDMMVDGIPTTFGGYGTFTESLVSPTSGKGTEG